MIRRWIVFAAVCLPLAAQTPSDFFESKIRPVLAAKCYQCHSAALASPAAGLRLDTKAGAQRVLVAGKPDDSRLIQAAIAQQLLDVVGDLAGLGGETESEIGKTFRRRWP